MVDINTVLKAWECCNPLNRRCFKCPYEAICFHDSFDRVAIADMVRLLKEQEAEIERLKDKQPKKGTWEVKIRHHPYPDGQEYKKFRCSVCGNDVDDHEDSDFCPWCGADMRKDG